MKQAESDFRKMWQEFREVKARASALEKEKKAMKKRLRELFGRAKRMDIGGGHYVERVTISQPEKIIPAFEYEDIKEKAVA